MRSFVGSEAHRELLCRFFVETHDPYKPAELDWPELDDASRLRLASLPIWDEAVKTEAATALIVRTMAETVSDPLFSEAIGLQGYEESRHAELLKLLTQRYQIPIPDFTPRPPRDPHWAFMRIGYGECFDSFFAFGLFALARDAALVPPGLVRLFETVMQEEGRHIIFHVNWIAYNQARLGFMRRPSYVFSRGLAMWLQMLRRLKTALRMRRLERGGEADGDGSERNFTMKAHESFRHITPGEFVTLCLAENERRLAPYDPRLLRPSFVPAVARAALKTLPGAIPPISDRP
jgi:hypothetical protein